MTPPTAKRVGPINTTNTSTYPTWNDYEILNFQKNYLTAGVVNKTGGDFAVAQHAAGANMSVDVAAGNALIQITNTNTDGTTYNVPFYCGVTTNVPISTADPTNPRIDLIYLKVDVSQNPDVGSGNIAVISVVAGTPAGSPSVPSTPANSIALAQIAVAAGATSIVTGNITDVRAAVTFNTSVFTNMVRKGLGNNLATVGGSANAITLTTSPAYASYASPMVIFFYATAANTTAVTVNVDGLGTKTMKRMDGATDLIANDIKNTQLVGISYDGTNFQMFTPIGQLGKSKISPIASITADTSAIGASSTSEIDLVSTTVLANTLVVGDSIKVSAAGKETGASSPTLTMRVYIGSHLLATTVSAVQNNTDWTLDANITVRAIGASGSLTASARYTAANYPTTPNSVLTSPVTVDTTTNQTLKITIQFNASNSSNTVNATQFDVSQISL